MVWCTLCLTNYKPLAYRASTPAIAAAAIVPPRYRVRTMALANVVWSVVIDFMAHRSQPRVIRC